jgi:hypothetical protein
MSRDRRTRDRLNVSDNGVSQLVATIQYDSGIPTPVRVRDLSRWGIGFSMDEQPQVGESVMFSLQYRGACIRFRATIKWANEMEPNQWDAGCEFANVLADDFLTNLSSANVLSPDAEREATWVKAIVRSDVTPNSTYPAEIVNYSRTGVCLATKAAFGPGESLLLEVDDNHRPRTMFVARVVWERPDQGCVLLGCSFPQPDDARKFYQAVRRHMEQQVDVPAPAPIASQTRRLTPGIIAGLTLVLGWGAIYLTGGWPQL